jgi:hypothetical protein
MKLKVILRPMDGNRPEDCEFTVTMTLSAALDELASRSDNDFVRLGTTIFRRVAIWRVEVVK